MACDARDEIISSLGQQTLCAASSARVSSVFTVEGGVSVFAPAEGEMEKDRVRQMIIFATAILEWFWLSWKGQLRFCLSER